MSSLLKDIQSVINRHSAENTSNTPDFILAQYLEQCLAAFDTAVQQRETWYGRDARPTLGDITIDLGILDIEVEVQEITLEDTGPIDVYFRDPSGEPMSDSEVDDVTGEESLGFRMGHTRI